ncbi:MAG: FUSC family protein [Verrucomicrobiota bacterium]
MKLSDRFLKDDLAGVHFAVNVFIATALLWLLLRKAANLNPIWAISSMVAASDPRVKQALSTFKGRLTNATVGCAVGLVFLVVAGRHEIALPFAMAVSVLISTYFVRIQIMWRQAPITTAIVLAAGWTHGSEITAVEIGIRRVAEVMLGCVVGVAVSWMMSKLWPLPETPKGGTSPAIPRG